MKIYRVELKKDSYPKALELWEKSVIATHNFLKKKDRIALKSEIPTYFKYVEAYLWFDGEILIGLSGTNDENLEMLFIDPKHFQKGYGTKILQFLITENKIKYVDVNKANHNAIKFYKKMGSKSIRDPKKINREEIIPSYILN